MKKLLTLLLALCMAVSCFAMAEEAPATYTYNIAVAEFPTNWNPHQSQTATDSDLMDWLKADYYAFDYNEAMDGYVLAPHLAVGEPEDVTAEYIGRFGLEEGAEHRAWKVTIRQDAMWEDGTPINAHDIEESVKRLLNPLAQNYRADSLYTSQLIIHNAQNYLYAGQTKLLDNGVNEKLAISDLTLGEDGIYRNPAGGRMYFALDTELDWLSGKTFRSYVDKYGADYFAMDTWEALAALADENGNVPITEDSYQLFVPITTANAAWGETEDDVLNYMLAEQTFPEVDYSEVGYFAAGDYEIVMVLDQPLEGFYLKYSMNCPLVKLDLYDACTTITDGVYTNSYGTTQETTASFGPYKLTQFQSDKVYLLEKNDSFFGYNDNAELYQTTAIQVNCVKEPSTRLEMFLNGQLDSYGLNKDDMEVYAASDYTYYSEGDSIFAMVLNPELEVLTETQKAAGENINKTILTLREFRMAMAYAIDRAAFCLATSPTNGPAFSLYSGQIIADPENGMPYRATDEAKQVIVNFWNLADEIGEGKLYADVDEAIGSVSGYNLEMAKQYFDKAYDLALEQGLMDDNDVIEICVGTPNLTSTFYNNGYEFIVNNYTDAVKGTKLEGKLTFTRDGTLGNAFSTALKNNNVDMLFGVGWTGSTFDPYNLFQVFVNPTYQYDSHYDANADMVTIELDGVEYTASAFAWADYLTQKPIEAVANGETVEISSGAEYAKRIHVLATLENNYMQLFNYIPLMNSSSANLKGMQIEYYTEDEIFPMGRGGVKYMTYNYSDAEWSEFVSSMGGTLNYK